MFLYAKAEMLRNITIPFIMMLSKKKVNKEGKKLKREEVKKLCDQLLGTSDVAEFTGIDRRVIAVYKNRPTFPNPICYIGLRPVWFKPDIEKWLKTRRKHK